MKLHLPVRLFRAVVALMAAVTATCQVYADELPTPTIAPEGYETTQVKTFDDLLYYDWQHDSHAFILQDNIEAEWSSQYGHWNSLYTSYYKDYPASMKLIGSIGGSVLNFDHLGTLCLLDDRESWDPYYHYFGISGTRIIFNDVEKVHLEGWGTAIHIEGGSDDYSSCGLTMQNCGDISFICSPMPAFSGEYDSQYDVPLSGVSINCWLDSKYDAVVLDNNGHVSFSKYQNGAIVCGEWNSNVVLSENDGLSFTNNYGTDRSAGISSMFLTLSSNGNVLFDANHTELSGAAIYAALLSMMNNGDVSFRNNEAHGQGGAICLNDYYENVDAYIFINNNKHVTFENNISNEGGGAIYTYAYSENYKGSIDNNESVIFRENSSIGNGGALSVNAYCIDLSISGNKTVIFEGNEVQSSDDSYVYGGAIYVCGQSWENNQTTVRISDNGSVIFRNNQADEGSAIYVDCWYSYLVDFSRNQSIDISSNGGISAVRGDVTMNDNSSINISNNEQDAISGKVSMYGNESVLFEKNGGVAVYGGDFINNGVVKFIENELAIWGGATIIGNNQVIFKGNTNKGISEGGGGGISGSVVLNNNRKVVFADNSTSESNYGVGRQTGAAISAGTCEIRGNESVEFCNNSAYSGNWSPAEGAAIYARTLCITDNENVLFENNYRSYTYGTRYEGIRATDVLQIRNNGSFVIEHDSIRMDGASTTADCDFSVGAGCAMTLDGSILISAGFIDFNAIYIDQEGQSVSQTGDIIFSGNEYGSFDKYGTSLIYKYESTFSSLLNLHDGRLLVQEGAIINGKGITVHSSVSGESTPTLLLNNGVLLQDKRNITMEAGTSLSLKGANSITAAAVVLESGSNLSFTLSGDNLTTAALTLTGSLNVAEGVILTLGSSDELLEDGRYILLSLSDGKQPTSWTKDNITISSVGWWRIGYDDLQWQNGQLSVELSYTEWINATGNALWNMASANWQKQAETTRITPGAALFFGDTGAGVVTVEGEQAPGHIIVDNSEGSDYLWQAAETGGSLMGAARLVKRGKGELTINLDNSYSGGTVLYDGVLTAGAETAFGTGDITVHGGVLNLADHALENNITATGGTLAGASACGGTLLVDGDVTLADDSTFGGVSIQSGSISGAALVDTSVVVNAGGQDVSIESDLVGSGSLVINGGQVVLKGENNYTGGTVINNGSLTLDNGSGLGSGDITLNGGWLDLKGNDPQGNLTINGGSLVSGYVLTEGNTLTVGAQGMKMLAEMTLAGGRIHFEGTILEALSGVSATDVTTISVANVAMVDAEGTVLLADFGEHALHLTADSFLYEGYGKLVYDEATHALSVELTDVNKWAAVKGAVWTNGDSSAWEDGATFVTGNRVVFDKDSTVTIVGDVEPASVLVDVATSLNFKTTYDKKLATWSGSIVGSGCVVKRGNGVLTLNDGNTYSGGTFIEGGAVIAGGAGSFGTGSITISGDYLDLKSKAVANDIILTGAATIKGGKKFLGTYSQTGGELLKGSVLNIAESATISGGLVNGTLSGTGMVSVTGAVELGESGKITTDKLMVSGSLAVSNKGLAMNAKTSAIEINGGMLASKGKVSAASLKLNGGSLSLSGALSVKDLTLGSGSLTLNSAKLATVKVGNSLTLEGDTTLNFGFNVTEKDVAKGKSYKVFTFKTIDASITDAELNELLGLGTDAATLSFDKKRKAITLTVTDAAAWNAYAEDVREEALAARRLMSLRPAAAVDPMLGKVADTLVQSTWGTAGASRAFGDTIAARGTHATEFANGKGSAWISTMGGSSRISSDGGHAGADYTLTGAAFGMEARLSEKSTIGMAIGNSWGKVSTFSAFPVDQDSTHQGIYGKHILGSSTTLSWMAAHTRTESDGKLAGMACDWTQDALQLDARVDKLFAISDRTTVSAFAGMQYLAIDKGECNGLSTGSLQNLRGEIGVSAGHKATDRTYVYGELSFIGDMVRNNPTATVGDYRSRGANPGRAGLNLSVGASYQLNDSWSLNGSYGLELMQNQTSHSANVGATYSF